MSAAVVTPLSLAEFNAVSESDAHALSGSCLDIERWVLEVGSGRPYPDWESLRARASDSAEVIAWDEVAGALARHPRIGERANGEPGDVALSASEQAGVVSSDVAALAAGNAAYEDRFGYVYLICATGLSGEQMLAALHERLTHDDQAERLVVMDELRRIAALRLAKAISR